MAVADERREGCDGCGQTVSLENLTAVTMPDGERIACCPQCEPHARAAAEQSASAGDEERTCDGCNGTVPRDELKDADLPDGTVISCCPRCLNLVPGQNDASAGSDPGNGSDGATQTGASSDRDGNAETTDLATTKHRCSQCHERVAEELFRVTTIDGRTEEMCPNCKAIAEEKGVVKSVKMRKSEAREILGVDDDATPEEIRTAFHKQVKSAHPDRKTGSRSAFKLVKQAYERLR